MRLSAQFTYEAIESLRFADALSDEMEYIYQTYGYDVYSNLEKHRKSIEKHFEKEEIKIKPAQKNKLFDVLFWRKQRFNLISEAVTGKVDVRELELEKNHVSDLSAGLIVECDLVEN